MHVCLDVQAAVAQRAGVGRYTRELALHLGTATDDVELTLFYFDFQGRATPPDAPGATRRPVRWMPGRLAQLAWKTVGWPPVDQLAGHADLYHFPNFILPPLRRGRAVVTIHDVSFLRYPEFADDANLRFLTRHIHDTVARADVIITDSHFSAGEIETLLHVPRERLRPIHLGIDPVFTPAGDTRVAAMRQSLNLKRPYLLAVGTIEPRKNLTFMIEVFETLCDFDGDLVLAGMPGWHTDDIFRRIVDSPRADRIRHLAYVPDTDLPALYSGAACLLQTSIYEGFGFPPLEAMACGTPVVSSCGGSLPEVIGDAGEVVEAFEREAWAERIQRVLSDTDRQHRLRERGRRHSERYRWSETAQRTADVYREVLA